MLLGYNTNGFAHHRLEDALQILADLGYSSVAITLDYHALNPFDADFRKQCENVRALLQELKLRCVIETGARFLLDPNHKHQPTLVSPTRAERERRWDFLSRSLDASQLLAGDAVSFWSGTPIEGTSENECWTRLVDGCRRLCDEAAKKNVWLAFEPEPGMFIDTMAKFEELVRRVDHPRFGLTLDVGHLCCQGELPIAEYLYRWKDRLWNVHIEDMRHGVHDHLMFGDGQMDFPPIFQALLQIGYAKGVHVELSRHSHDAVNTATRALQFLRGCSLV